MLYKVFHSPHVTRYNLFGSLIGLGCRNPVEAFVISSQVGFSFIPFIIDFRCRDLISNSNPL